MKIRSFLAAAFAASVAIGMSHAGAQQAITYATYGTPGFPTVQTDLWFMEEVNKRTNGAFKFDTYFGGALLKPVEILPGVGEGAAQIGHSSPQYNLNLLPLSDVVQPFTTEKADAASLAFNDLYKNNKAVIAEYEKANLKLLYALVPGEMVLYTHKQIRSPDDLKGLRIRALTGVGAALSELGGTPVAIPFTEAVDVFQRGGMDGLANSTFDIAITSGFHEIAEHVSDFGQVGVFATLITVMNLDLYNSFTPEVRAVIDEVSEQAPLKYLEFNEHVMAQAVDKLVEAKGVTVTLTDEATLPRYQVVAEGLRAKWADNLEAKGLPGAQVMDEFLKYVRERETSSTYETGLRRVVAKRGQ